MRTGRRGPPPNETSHRDGNVVSMVERLERRRIAALRDRSDKEHVRELEAKVDALEMGSSLKERDFDAEIAALEADVAADADERRRAIAAIRSMRALASCVRGDAEAGHAEWAAVIAEAPDFAFPHLLRGRWNSSTEPASAIADLDRAAILDPNNATIYLRRGECLAEQGEHERAIANFRRCVTLDARSYDAHAAMARSLEAAGRPAEAVTAWDRAIAIAPRYVDFFLRRGRLRDGLGRHDAAVEDFDRVLALSPGHNVARFLRALAHGHAGRTDRAIEELEALIASAPGDAIDHRALGGLLMEVGRFEDAVAVLSRAIELAPGDAIAFERRCHAKTSIGDRAGAIADIERAIALAPDDEEYAIRLSILGVPDLPEDAALAQIDSVIARRPEIGRFASWKGEFLSRAERHEEAIAAFDRAIELDADDVAAVRGRAKANAKLKRLEAALADTDRLVALAPDDALAWLMRGNYRFQLEGDKALTEADYDRAIALDPDSVWGYWFRGCLRDDQSRHIAAMADLDKVVELSPNNPDFLFRRGSCRAAIINELHTAAWDDEDAEEPDEEENRARMRASAADFERVLELGRRDDVEVYFELAILYDELGDRERRSATIERWREALPEAAGSWYWAAQFRRQEGDHEGADADLARAVALGWKVHD